MMPPNWFDRDLSGQLENATAEQALQLICSSKPLIDKLAKVLKEHDDQNAKQPVMGPSRSQVIRNAVAAILNAD